MKVHRVRTKTLLLFLVAFSASTSGLGVVCPFTLVGKLGTGPENGYACLVEELEGISCETG